NLRMTSLLYRAVHLVEVTVVSGQIYLKREAEGFPTDFAALLCMFSFNMCPKGQWGTEYTKRASELPRMINLEAQHFARHWIAAWNSHDLDAILSQYAPEVVLTSPVAAKLLDVSSGKVIGKQALGDYFARGLAAYPDLKFELVDVLSGISSVVLYYVNHKGT